MAKQITVFGATGNQGGSVINHILADPQLSEEFKIRGITRDATKKPAQHLVQRGVDVVTADLNSVSSLRKALRGSHTVFLVTNFWGYGDGKTEFTQGKNVTDVAKEVGVSHIIFSSLMHVGEATKGRLHRVAHFDSKAEVESYIRNSGLHATFVLPGYFMSNYFTMLRKCDDGIYRLKYPIDGRRAKFPLVDPVDDMGLFVKAALKNADHLGEMHLLAAAGYYTAEEIVDTFVKITGKEAHFVRITQEEFKMSLPEAIGDEYLENHLFIENPGYYLGESLGETLNLLDSRPTSWADFVKKHSGAWD